MPAPDSTLAAIQKKVRRITRSPSTAQLSDSDLNEYINTFIVYDFPEILRTFNLRTEYSFYTNPGQDMYFTDTASFGGAVNNRLYDFQNKYLTVHPPFYIAGYQSLFSQSPEQFYGIYPKLTTLLSTGIFGDGVSLSFTGNINTALSSSNVSTASTGILQRSVLFNSTDLAGEALALVDVPVIDPNNGYNTTFGNLYNPNSAAYQAALVTPPSSVSLTNRINYVTGDYKITFSNAPDNLAPVNCQLVFVQPAQPRAVLFYANTFVIRPVPDQAYQVNFEVYKRPDYFLSAGDEPELQEYWQYIAYGASKKIFDDRLDLDSVQAIMPEFRRQEMLVQRRTIVQNTNQRNATIYSEQTSNYSSYWGWGNSNQ